MEEKKSDEGFKKTVRKKMPVSSKDLWTSNFQSLKVPESPFDLKYLFPDDQFSRWVGFGLIGATHLYQLYQNNTPFWTFFHGSAAALSFYWPVIQDQGLTHKTWGHEALGLLAMIPHLEPVQIFGTLMLADKLWNYDLPLLVTSSEGKSLFRMKERGLTERSSYGLDNMFADNWEVPRTPAGLMSNVPFLAVASMVSVENPEMYAYLRPFVYAFAAIGWLAVFNS